MKTENNTGKSIELTTKTQRKINEFTRRKIIKKREGKVVTKEIVKRLKFISSTFEVVEEVTFVQNVPPSWAACFENQGTDDYLLTTY